MKKVFVWFALLIASIAFVLFIFKENWFLPLSILFMIGIHELGHLGAARYLGYKTGGFYFIPGIGGAAILKEIPKKRWHAFWIWYAGPAVGFLESLLLFLANFLWLQMPILYLATFLWALINLINMLPALPLDGGKIIWSIVSNEKEDYLQGIVYHILTLAALVWIFNIGGIVWLLLIFIFGLIDKNNLIKIWHNEGPRIPLTNKQRVYAVLLTVSLQVSLILLGYVSLVTIF